MRKTARFFDGSVESSSASIGCMNVGLQFDCSLVIESES
jgi:hypothetical protein